MRSLSIRMLSERANSHTHFSFPGFSVPYRKLRRAHTGTALLINCAICANIYQNAKEFSELLRKCAKTLRFERLLKVTSTDYLVRRAEMLRCPREKQNFERGSLRSFLLNRGSSPTAKLLRSRPVSEKVVLLYTLRNE